MIEHDYEDDRYYQVREIEHNGDHCGPCRYQIRKGFCAFFGDLMKDNFNGQSKRNKRCLESQQSEDY